MKPREFATGIAAIVLALYIPAVAAMYKIDNPADRIQNPANKMYNPASKINNPAANIYNPASRLANPNPLSPPTQPEPATAPVEQEKDQHKAKSGLTIPPKRYYFETVKVYITEAKKAFNQDNYVRFVSITEDALRRINGGTLKASEKMKKKLEKYRRFGYGLIEEENLSP